MSNDQTRGVIIEISLYTDKKEEEKVSLLFPTSFPQSKNRISSLKIHSQIPLIKPSLPLMFEKSSNKDALIQLSFFSYRKVSFFL